MWSITFKTLNGRTVIVTIGGTEENIALTPSANPLTLQYDDNDDIFTPVRLSSGNINVVVNSANHDDAAEIDKILRSTPKERPVSILVNGVKVWSGYVKSESYNHKLFGCGETISIPIVSCLSLLESEKVQITSSDYIRSFGTILVDIFDRLGMSHKYTYIPQQNNDAPAAKLNLLNYISLKDNEEIETDEAGNIDWYDGASLLDLLNDMCIIQGWTCFELEDKVVFTSSENHDVRYIRYSRQNLLDGNSTYDEKLTTKTIEEYFKFAGDDHSFSTIPGKNRIEFTGKKNTMNDAFTTDYITALSKVIGEGSDFVNSKGETRQEYLLSANPLFECESDYTGEMGVLKACISNNIIRGSFIELVGDISNIKKYGTTVYDYSGQVSPCILLISGTDSYPRYSQVTIRPLCYYSLMAPIITMKISFSVASTAGGEFIKPATPVAPNNTILPYINGIPIDSKYISEENGEMTVILGYYGTPYNGQPITIRKIAEAQRFLRIDRIEIGYNYKNLEMFGAKKTFNDDIIVRIDNNNGFKDDYKVSCSLTPYQPFCISGIFINSSEKVMANRMARYYAKSRSRLEIVTKCFDSGITIQDTRRTIKHNGLSYSIVGQSIDFANETNKITLQEDIQ